ncbi:glycosyltransferase family 87 protein [Ancylobacter lacus]|uniref:glycosyltransferase family 87 protein n=1 Tax=Ancylobacter lacus TaxID=2579970 RepID=UPI001BCD420A|nr:glycosyltransferase family 87 protein [Ancylobacter lacus]MBS7538176.1 DUF2029 domain-containing protein [Ancylobacter lacus]
MSTDLYERHEEVRLLAGGHYPRADILRAEGVGSTANTVYPPNAFPWLWLLSPFESFRLNQLWHGAWSLAALGVVLGYAFAVGAAFSGAAAVACLAAVLSMPAVFATFRAGQYGLILLALMLGSTLLLSRGRACQAGFLMGIALFKPTYAATMSVVFLRERRYAGLAVAGLVVAASLAGVCLWSGHGPLALVAATYPVGGMRFTGQGYSLVSLLAATGIPPQFASLLCAGAGLTGLFAALRFLDAPRDPLAVLALAGLAARISFYHRGYDDVLLIFLALACLRRWIAAPCWPSAAVALATLVSLQLPGRWLHPAPPGLVLTLFATWIGAAVFVVAEGSGKSMAPQPC